jgi:hypothetical protein
MTTTKRIQATGLVDVDEEDFGLADSAFHLAGRYEPLVDEHGRVVAEHGVPLRVLDCTINGQKVDGILDEGSTVIIMSSRFWSKIGVALDPSRHIHIQVANNAETSSRGVLVNLPVEIAGITLFLQVHVVEGVPFDFLLGKPFYTLARTSIETDADGRTDVTIRDPNSSAVKTISSRERGTALVDENHQRRQKKDF